jgi:hypothetical protein
MRRLTIIMMAAILIAVAIGLTSCSSATYSCPTYHGAMASKH